MTTPALRDWLLDDHGLDVLELTRVHGGADLTAEVWKATAQAADRGITEAAESRAAGRRIPEAAERRITEGVGSGAAGLGDRGPQGVRSDRPAGMRSYAVKWTGGGTGAGPLVGMELAAAGVVGVAAPVRTVGGELWSVRGGRRLTVMPWVDGKRAAEVGLTDEQWTAYGVLLAGVHSVEPSDELRRVLPRLNPVNARMPALLQDLDKRLTGTGTRDAVEAELVELWRHHREAILGLLEPADEPRGTAVICHADPHLGNVIVGEGVHLIDWDDVVLAPREQDLMFLLGGMGSLGPTTDRQLAAFFNGYGEVQIDARNLHYYRHARALEDVALWAEQAITGPDREDAVAVLRGVLGPAGLAPLAVS